MSTENQGAGGAEGQAGGEADVNEPKMVSFESHSKLLSEKKKLAADMQAMKSRLEEIENQKLEAEGDLKKQNESLKAKIKEKEERLSGTVKTFAEKAVKSQFARTAEKLGCVDPEMAFRAVSLDDIELDENFNFDDKVLTAKIEELAKQKSYLFKKDVSAPRDKTPGINVQAESLSEMSLADQWALFRKLK